MQREQESIHSPLENLVELAKAGNKDSLEEIVRKIQDKVYGLALRMLYHPADAEDATQEILIKIITHLDSFEQRSSFFTWAYRIASNHLLTTKKRMAETYNYTFEIYEQMLEKRASYLRLDNVNPAEMGLMVEEMKLTCTQGLLLCLSREVRLAFILGEVFGATTREGAEILDISMDAYRKRLSRGRKLIRNFMIKNCGLINSSNICQCVEAIKLHIKMRTIDPDRPLFITHPSHNCQKTQDNQYFKELDELGRVTAVFRSHPEYAAPEAFVGIVKELVDSGRFQLLNNH
jgi:RNA polymerase sigma factor (sigma-70 family)